MVVTEPKTGSAASWEDLQGLSPELRQGIAEAGFVRPSRIQAAALPMVLQQRCNLIGQAQNGSGKTATFALAVLAKGRSSARALNAVLLRSAAIL